MSRLDFTPPTRHHSLAHLAIFGHAITPTPNTQFDHQPVLDTSNTLVYRAVHDTFDGIQGPANDYPGVMGSSEQPAGI
jgi:hypothetical protein